MPRRAPEELSNDRCFWVGKLELVAAEPRGRGLAVSLRLGKTPINHDVIDVKPVAENL
jgi:hypothetical protein